MNEQTIIVAAALLGLIVLATAALRGWHGWLAYKNRELEMQSPAQRQMQGGSPEGAARIELADLKERVRQLEAIANGVEL